MSQLIVCGFMGACPIAGVVWQHLHYIVGLQRLGHDVYYVEDSAAYPYNPITYQVDQNWTYAADNIERLADEFGFREHWCYRARFLPDQPVAGLTQPQLLQLYQTADALLNVCGSQELNDDLRQCRRLIYIESDPGVEQIKVDRGDATTRAYLQEHQALFTFGENVGTARFPVPTHGLNWLPTRQPVVTDLWQTSGPPPAGARFTSIANWSTSGIKDIEWRGDKYLWSKSLEFLRFREAPRVAGEHFELATTIPDPEVRQSFVEAGWVLSDPTPLSVDHQDYRRYIQDSKGEWTAAKDQYIRLHTGWFSDRSACYLAAGRPVITQQTGFTDCYGADGCGLLAFETLAEIPGLVAAINGDYPKHSQAAREVAREYFEAEKVLASLLARAGL